MPSKIQADGQGNRKAGGTKKTGPNESEPAKHFLPLHTDYTITLENCGQILQDRL